MVSRFLGFVVCILGLLVSVDASATEYMCNVRIAYNTGLNTPTQYRVALTLGKGQPGPEMERDAKRAVWRTVKLEKPSAVWLTDLSTATCGPDKRADKSATPPTYNPKKQAPDERSWYCRVKTKWHMGPKSGLVNEGIYVTAPNETGAMAAALVRIQERTKTMFSDADRRKVTFTLTEVSCT